MATSCFCAVQETQPGPPRWTYSGYTCINGQATPCLRFFTSPQPATAKFVANCACGNANCPNPIQFTKATTKSSFIYVYERGVPNPKNPLHEPDEPIQGLPVIAEYTADFKLTGKQHHKARLIQFAFDYDGPHLLRQIGGAAFLIHKNSPPSPLFVPHFSQADGWVTVTPAGDSYLVEVNGLGKFQLEKLYQRVVN
jgi:hypothetical protein